MDRFFVCPNLSVFTINNDNSLSCTNNGASVWGETAEEPISYYDLIFTPQLSQSDFLMLSSIIAMYFATCWCYQIIGRQIGTK